MAKFSRKAKPNITAPLKSSTEFDTLTHEGGEGVAWDDKTALFLLGVTNMVSEDTFYEDKGARDKRFLDLTRKVAAADPEWIAGFIPYLRDEMNMRSASVVLAVEAVRALLGTGQKKVNLRSMINSAIVRADEPGELIAYYISQYGKNIPQPIKRGVSDAVVRLYTERNALKYDGQSRDVRMGDVIDLTHPIPLSPQQSGVFKYLLERRHNRDWPNGYEGLDIINKAHQIDSIPVEERRTKLLAGEIDFSDSGFTWERVSGWINGPMDAPVWEAIIPQMGYMALLRNLRNFDEASINDASKKYVKTKLSDKNEVARSRQFPFRFYSAYRNTHSVVWSETLEAALNAAVLNIPTFNGKTLVLTDLSGSMSGFLSGRSKVQRMEVGAVFAACLAARNEVTLVPYATSHAVVEVPRGVSALRLAESTLKDAHLLGGGTDTFAALEATYQAGVHQRVVIFTDEQSFAGRRAVLNKIDVPIYNFNLAGYAQGHMPVGQKQRYEFGGFNDSGFKAIQLLEQNTSVKWPWEK